MRAASWIVLVACAAGSVGAVLHVGSRNPSVLLMALFVFWVLAPFAALGLATAISKNWPAGVRAALNVAMLAIPVVSLGIYGWVALGPPRAKPAAVFLLVPAASWLSIAGVLLAGRRHHLSI